MLPKIHIQVDNSSRAVLDGKAVRTAGTAGKFESPDANVKVLEENRLSNKDYTLKRNFSKDSEKNMVT